MSKHFIPRLLALSLGGVAALLSACQTAPVTGATAPASAPLPALPVPGAAHYVLDAGKSDVRFLVYRAGALALLIGHNHVIQAKELSGDVYLAADFQASGFALTLPVAGFVVDAPEARAVEGPDFSTQPSAAAIDGTRKNMLGPGGLDAAHYPEVHIRSVRLLGPDWGPDATVRIELHGVSRDLSVPIAVSHEGDALNVTGSFELKQSDFGMAPFSVAGGGLQVADTLRVRFRLVATKAP